MFKYKHEIVLSDGKSVHLFGEDFFADTSTFWNAHQTTLNGMYESVTTSGFPIKVIDLETNLSKTLHNRAAFHAWLKANHPFDFSRIENADGKEQNH